MTWATLNTLIPRLNLQPPVSQSHLSVSPIQPLQDKTCSTTAEEMKHIFLCSLAVIFPRIYVTFDIAWLIYISPLRVDYTHPSPRKSSSTLPTNSGSIVAFFFASNTKEGGDPLLVIIVFPNVLHPAVSQ